jgi:hypothetical protein
MKFLIQTQPPYNLYQKILRLVLQKKFGSIYPSGFRKV